MSRLKIDVHAHILPERWPDLKEVNVKANANITMCSVRYPDSRDYSINSCE